jgi:hypothetical protein
MSNMAIILSMPKGYRRRHGNFKGLSHERGWVKSVENLSDSPFKRDLSIDTTSAKSISLDSPFQLNILKVYN